MTPDAFGKIRDLLHPETIEDFKSMIPQCLSDEEMAAYIARLESKRQGRTSEAEAA